MDTQAQRQAIVRLLAGAPPGTRPPLSALDEPWRTIYRRLTPARNRAEAETLIWNATAGLQDRRQLASDLVARLPPDSAFNPFPSLHDLAGQLPPVDWLWPSWIPYSMLTLFGAAPGAGKSLVALDLARRIIAGLPFPDGAPVPCPGSNVLIVDAEGAPALLNQRAQAWDIDRRRLFLMLAPDSRGLINLAHPEQQLLLLNMCRQLRPALVVVDSLAAATARGETSLQGARAILGFLAAIARQARLAMLVIHHLRKRAPSARSASQIVADDLRGSSHLSAAARSVLALSVLGRPPTSPILPAPEPAPGDVDPSSDGPLSIPDTTHPSSDGPLSSPDTAHPSSGGPPSSPATAHPSSDGSPSPPALAELRRLEVVKTNLCRLPPPLGLIFEGEEVPVPTLRYTTLDEPWSEPSPPPAQVELCGRWLLQFLAAAGAPVRPASVVRAAGEMGFSRSTLYRARHILASSIVDLGTGPRDPQNRWALAPAPSPLPPEGTP